MKKGVKMQNLKSVKKGFLFLAIISLYLTGCDNIPFLSPKKATPPKKPKTTKITPVIQGTLVAKVNNIPITLEDLNQDIANYNAMIPDSRSDLKITTKEQKISYLNSELVQRILLYQYGLNKGLDKDPDILRALRRAKIELIVLEVLKRETEQAQEVTAQEIQDYYDEYKDKDPFLKTPEERRIREIVVPTELEAREILIQILQGADFVSLARSRSKSVTSSKGGDLGFISPGTKFREFDEVAFSDALEVGKVSNVFKGPDGYYIIKLEEKRGGEEKPLSEVWDDLKAALTLNKQQQRILDIIKDLESKAKIEVYEGVIK
jgi:parvulin-like peptidyl-prolyl isomerase